MPKLTRKKKTKQNRRTENSQLSNFVFLKVVNNIHDTFGANHFTP